MPPLLYLVALAPKDTQTANAQCSGCGQALRAPLAQLRVHAQVDSAFTCPSCLPKDAAVRALITLSIADEALDRGQDLAKTAGRN